MNTEFVHHDTPEPGIRVEQVGTEPEITYHVEWPQMQHPTPKMFHDVGDLEVKLAVLSGHFQIDEVNEAAQDALEAIQDLQNVMLNHRDLDDGERQAVAMGNLEALPEVTDKYVEDVPAGDSNGQ